MTNSVIFGSVKNWITRVPQSFHFNGKHDRSFIMFHLYNGIGWHSVFKQTQIEGANRVHFLVTPLNKSFNIIKLKWRENTWLIGIRISGKWAMATAILVYQKMSCEAPSANIRIRSAFALSILSQVYRVYAQMDTAKLDKTNTGLG